MWISWIIIIIVIIITSCTSSWWMEEGTNITASISLNNQGNFEKNVRATNRELNTTLAGPPPPSSSATLNLLICKVMVRVEEEEEQHYNYRSADSVCTRDSIYPPLGTFYKLAGNPQEPRPNVRWWGWWCSKPADREIDSRQIGDPRGSATSGQWYGNILQLQ